MLFIALLVAAAPCLAGSLPTARLLPVIPGDAESRSTPFIAWYRDLTPAGYVEEEYLVSGQAGLFGYADEAAQSPSVKVVETGIPYTTRILVRRPRQPESFSGTVFLEVLNATAGWDGDPIWQSTHEYMIREGAIWVGVTGKPSTVEFLRTGWGEWPRAKRNAGRYATLSMPRFGQVWGMLGQIGLLLRSPGVAGNPLASFDVERMIMVGYSQSALYQVTFANSFHARAVMPGGSPVYDGYFISAGRPTAKHVMGPTAKTPEELPLGDRRNLIRVDVPVIRFQTQTEVVGSGSYRVRQAEPEYPMLRFYEMAGGAHVDAHLNALGGQSLVRDLGLPPSFCPEPAFPYNPIRIGYTQSALLDALEQWIASGALPPASRFLELTNRDGQAALALDSDGNAMGGLRPPEIRVPRGVYLGTNRGPGFCALFGGFTAFDEDRLTALYADHFEFIRQMARAIDEFEGEAFILPEDAESMRSQLRSAAAE